MKKPAWHFQNIHWIEDNLWYLLLNPYLINYQLLLVENVRFQHIYLETNSLSLYIIYLQLFDRMSLCNIVIIIIKFKLNKRYKIEHIKKVLQIPSFSNLYQFFTYALLFKKFQVPYNDIFKTLMFCIIAFFIVFFCTFNCSDIFLISFIFC